MDDVNFKFDSNYLIVEIPNNAVIKYHADMLTKGNIKYLLPVQKQVNNNSICFYYDVRGRIPLEKLVIRNKLNDDMYLKFVLNVLSAACEVAEYGLMPAGLLLDNNYIFVQSIEINPNFVYLPIKNNSESSDSIITYLKNSIVSGIVDISNNGTIQRIVDVLNSNKSLKEMIIDLSKGGNAENLDSRSYSSMNVVSNPNPKPNTYKSPRDFNSSPKSDSLNLDDMPEPVPNLDDKRDMAAPMPPPVPIKNKKDEKKKKQNEKNTKQVANGESGKPDMEKIRPILMGVGVGILILFAVLFSTGMFADEEGNDDYSVLIAAPILIFAIDYMIYSKLKTKYVIGELESESEEGENKKKKQKKKSEKVKSKKISNNSQKEIYVPSADITPPQSSGNPILNVQNQNAANISPFEEQAQVHINAGIEQSKTVIMTDENIKSPYLENISGERITINSGLTRVGKMKGKVDAVITSQKVSRIHADIIWKNDKIYIVDLGSTNGTYINGSPARITSNMEYELHNNDTVVFASEKYTVHC